MNKTTKIVALLMALVLCLSFAACGGNEEPETTTAPDVEVTGGADVMGDVDATTAADETTAAEGDTTVADETTAAGETTTAAEGEATTVAGETTTAASAKPEGTAAIVAYFNTAVNAVKTNAKSLKQNHVTNYLAGTPTLSSGIKGIYNLIGGDDWLDETLKKNGHGTATYTGADIDAKFPVEGESWSSKLTADDVVSATCTESNGVYTIKIVTKADGKSTNVKHGQGHNPKAFNVILPGIVNDNIPGPAAGIVGLASMNYPSSSVVITVDAATGHVKTAEYDLKWTINFDEMGISLPLGTVSSYAVNW